MAYFAARKMSVFGLYAEMSERGNVQFPSWSFRLSASGVNKALRLYS